MKSVFILAAALTLTAPLPALAQVERLSDGGFLSATRCAAYADLPQLQGDAFNASSLKQAIGNYAGPTFMYSRARDAERRVRVAGVRAGGDAERVERLRDQRNEACADFVASGLVQASAGAQAS